MSGQEESLTWIAYETESNFQRDQDDPERLSGESDSDSGSELVTWEEGFQNTEVKTDEIDGEVEPLPFRLQEYSDEKLIRELTTAHPDLCKQLYLIFMHQTREAILEN